MKRTLSSLLALTWLCTAGCEVVANFDRDKIPTVAPVPSIPSMDGSVLGGGGMDAGSSSDASVDAGDAQVADGAVTMDGSVDLDAAANDGGPVDAGSDAELDATIEDAATDAGDDAGDGG